MKHSYLHEIKNHSKKLYQAVCFLITIQLILTCLNFQITPFYVWSMYGAPQPKPASFPIYVLICDKDTFNFPTWMDHRKMFFTYTIPQYDQYSRDNFQDLFEHKTKTKLAKINLPETFYSKVFNTKTEIRNYPEWLKTYMESNLRKPIHTLKVKKYWIHYNAEERVVPDSSKILINE